MVPGRAALQELVPAAEAGLVLVVTPSSLEADGVQSRASCSALAALTRGAAASIRPRLRAALSLASERPDSRPHAPRHAHSSRDNGDAITCATRTQTTRVPPAYRARVRDSCGATRRNEPLACPSRFRPDAYARRRPFRLRKRNDLAVRGTPWSALDCHCWPVTGSEPDGIDSGFSATRGRSSCGATDEQRI